MSEIKIKFEGPRADDAKQEFMAWFLDGGGEFDFLECIQMHYGDMYISGCSSDGDDVVVIEVAEEEEVD